MKADLHEAFPFDPPRTPYCASCGKILVASVKTKHVPRLAAIVEADPFCSSACCREWYGCPVPVAPRFAEKVAA